MGGQAFARLGPNGATPLQIPRMSPQRYELLRDHFLQLLNPYFAKVVAPPEAPEKTDYGDIDILVEQHAFRQGLSAQEIAGLVEAERYVTTGSSESFAVKLPLERGDETVPFTQLDIHKCHHGYLEWEYFTKSYGDLWQIVGLTIRNLGLTASDQGLHVRIPEIEVENARHSRVFMTQDPIRAMRFIGLDHARFAAGFSTESEMFAWIATGRLFNGENCVSRQGSNDRQRLRKRPQFRRFVEEWVPNNRHLWMDKQVPSRSQVLHEALREFDIESAYKERLEHWRKAQAEKQTVAKLASIIPLENPEKLNLTIRGLKRWVYMSPWEGLEIRSEAVMEPQGQCSFSAAVHEFSEGAVLRWVENHWQEVTEREKQRVKTVKRERETTTALLEAMDLGD